MDIYVGGLYVDLNKLSDVKRLIRKGFDVNGFVNDYSLLQHAFNKKVIKFLLDEGANPDLPIRHGFTPLQKAANEEGNEEVVKMLLDKGADPHGASRINGRSPLACAFENENVATMKVLFDRGVSPNGPTINNNTLLQGTIGMLIVNTKMLKLLLVNGANPDGPIQEGIMPLHQAIRSSERIAVNLLLCAGADPNARYQGGNTPLQEAIGHEDNQKTLFLLIAFGAKTEGLENNLQIANILNRYDSSEGVMREQVRRMTGIRSNAELNLQLESLGRKDLLSLVKYMGASKLTPGFVVNFKQITDDGIQSAINEYSGNRVPERKFTKEAKETLLLIEKIKPKPTIEVGFKKEGKKRFNMFAFRKHKPTMTM